MAEVMEAAATVVAGVTEAAAMEAAAMEAGEDTAVVARPTLAPPLT